MTIKQYFERARQAERSIWLIKRQQEHAMAIATSMGSTSETNIRSNTKRSRVETAGVLMADLTADLQSELAQYTAIVTEARSLISKIPQQRFRDVLTLRYLCNHSWKTISDEMDYADPKSVYRVHGFALKAAEKYFVNTT